MKLLRRLIFFLISAGLIAALAFYFHVPSLVEQKYTQLTEKPCQKPITYRIGTIDPKFKITNATVIADLEKAEKIWEAPTDRQLFKYDPTSEVVVNFEYDYRQEATDRLKKLGIQINDSEQGYNAIKKTYDSLKKSYDDKKSAFNSLYKNYQDQNAKYADEVAAWNASDHSSKETYDHLQQTQSNLEALRTQLQQAQDSLNATVDDFNAAVQTLNKLVAHLNLNIKTYNQIGAVQGKEFTEGTYSTDQKGKRITIYEFNNSAHLIRVLAHEMGHALGLEHTDNPTDIMYRLNESKNDKLTENDKQALEAICGQ